VLTQFGTTFLGNAAGSTVGNAIAGTGISLGTFVDNSQLTKIMSDAARATVSTGNLASGGISILGSSIPILSAELEKAVKEVVDEYKPTIGNIFSGSDAPGAGIRINSSDWELDTTSGEWINNSTPGWTLDDTELFKPNIDISGGTAISADRLFRISADDLVAEKISSKSLSDIFTAENISRVVDESINRGVDLSKTEAERYLNNYIQNIRIGDMLSKDALSFLPRTINDVIKSVQLNPSVMMGSVAASAAFQTTNILRSSIGSAFSALTTQKDNLVDSTISSITISPEDLGTTIYESAPKALAYGLNNSFGDLIKNNSIVAEFGGSTGIFSKFDIIDNNISTVTNTIQQNIESLQKQFDVISNVPGTTYKEEIASLIETYENETNELLDSLEQSIQITVNDINNTSAFIVDPTV
jgi:hypothetical protein